MRLHDEANLVPVRDCVRKWFWVFHSAAQQQRLNMLLWLVTQIPVLRRDEWGRGRKQWDKGDTSLQKWQYNNSTKASFDMYVFRQLPRFKFRVLGCKFCHRVVSSTSLISTFEKRTLLIQCLVPPRPKGTNRASDVRGTTPLIGGLSRLIKMGAGVWICVTTISVSRIIWNKTQIGRMQRLLWLWRRGPVVQQAKGAVHLTSFWCTCIANHHT